MHNGMASFKFKDSSLLMTGKMSCKTTFSSFSLSLCASVCANFYTVCLMYGLVLVVL